MVFFSEGSLRNSNSLPGPKGRAAWVKTPEPHGETSAFRLWLKPMESPGSHIKL